MNLDRIRLQRATEVALGIGAAFTKEDLDREWFDAVARDEGEVDELHFTVNAQRESARLKSNRFQ